MDLNRRPRSASGFTLIELVCAMSVMGLLSVLAARIISSTADQYVAATVQTELCLEMSTAMERIVQDLRQTRLKNTLTPDLSSMTGSSIAWTDPDGPKSLSLNGSDLVLTDSIASSPLVRGVTSLGVQAYDDSGLALTGILNTAQLAAVRRVEITLTAQRQGVTETLRTRVYLRMLMSGTGM